MRETAWTMTLSSGPSVSKTSPATITCSTWLAAATSPIRSMASKRASPSAARTSGSNRPKGLPSCQSAVWRKRMDQDPVLWGAESGGSAQSVLTSRICSTLLQLASRKRSLPNTSASALARETATLMRLSEKRNYMQRAVSSAEEAVMERSEEHTSELQSLMRISYAVYSVKKTN